MAHYDPITGKFLLDYYDTPRRDPRTQQQLWTVKPDNEGNVFIGKNVGIGTPRHLDETRPPKSRKVRRPNDVPDNNIQGDVYTIKKGDTFYNILRKTGANTKDMMSIAKANGIDDPDKIYVGQKIKIPGYVAPRGSDDRKKSMEVGRAKAQQRGQNPASVNTRMVKPNKPVVTQVNNGNNNTGSSKKRMTWDEFVNSPAVKQMNETARAYDGYVVIGQRRNKAKSLKSTPARPPVSQRYNPQDDPSVIQVGGYERREDPRIFDSYGRYRKGARGW